MPDRTGVFTSGIVSVLDDHRIALFFTGHRHAGENLAAVLKQRASQLGPPMQMCDALSRNMPEQLEAIVASCLSHGRRRFVEVAMNFPQQCLRVLQILKDVYKNDAEAKSQGMSAEQRLQFHQTKSGPKMDELKAWLTEQIEQRKVEPNSSLGEAVTYMLKHWNELTLFLRQPGAPLDNDALELPAHALKNRSRPPSDPSYFLINSDFFSPAERTQITIAGLLAVFRLHRHRSIIGVNLCRTQYLSFYLTDNRT
jgi:transposase